MPKERATTDPLGLKLLQVLRELGRPNDLHYLAEVFGVKVQSVYDWIDFGRLSKDRYQKLAEWSGKSLDWWFDIQTGANQYFAREPDKIYYSRPKWPFADINEQRFCALGPDTIAMIEQSAKLMLQAANHSHVFTSAPGVASGKHQCA